MDDASETTFWPVEVGGVLANDGIVVTVRANRFGALRVAISSEVQTLEVRLTLSPAEARLLAGLLTQSPS